MKEFFERLFKTILFIVIVLALIVFIMPVGINTYIEYKTESAPQHNSVWMKDIPDYVKLNEITIPGTHNSATKYVDIPFFSNCQTYSVGKQLEMGYRYLDIRLSVFTDKTGNKSLKFMHGFTFCREDLWPWSEKLDLNTVLEECYNFLDTHPNETILFAVKQEHGDEPVAEFEKLLNSYVNTNRNKWLLTDTYPSMKDARGKIILLRRYEDEAGLGKEAGISFIWDDQGGRREKENSFEKSEYNKAALYVQDHYELGNNLKWLLFYYGLANPADTAKGEAAISFLSTKGVLPYGYPFFHAKVLNKKFKALTLDDAMNYGWIVVDFADAELAENIYMTNFKR